MLLGAGLLISLKYSDVIKLRRWSISELTVIFRSLGVNNTLPTFLLPYTPLETERNLIIDTDVHANVDFHTLWFSLHFSQKG